MPRHRLLAPTLFLVLALLAAACGSDQASPTTFSSSEIRLSSPDDQLESGSTRPVIVDYSPTVSDVGALLYLLSHPDVDVIAVTLPVTGEAGCELGIEVTLGILAMYELTDVPVACDPEVPNHAEDWPADFLAGSEALASGLPGIEGMVADSRRAHELIADVAAASDQPVTLYAVAPLTNVARALEHNPGLADHLEQIVIMGGAVEVPGNVGSTDAEWNFFIDVPAAASVLASGAEMILVPLDATNDVPVPVSWERDLQGAEQNQQVAYLESLVHTFPAVTSGFFFLWDELAASVAAGEATVVTEQMNLMVADEPGQRYGDTVRDPAGSRALVATAVPDPNGFYAHFIMVLAES